ncbi:MAG: alkaline phosphatase family protein [Thermodesulfobacteriota bacterium]|nr:alkaline phosphatase family protein [Thermodesulfobacteriota bacterium]
MKKRVIIIGLDCATPQLIFKEHIDDLPNIRRLLSSGIYGELESCDPPITIPAWTVMMSGKDPGKLGIYGFRNRKDYSYDGLFFATSSEVKEDRVWDILSCNDKKVILVGVPQTYPPKKINGYLVSCFLTPDINSQYTYPHSFRHEVEKVVGRYIFDVENFRTEDKKRLLADIYVMTEKRFRLMKYLIKSKDWDFLMGVEIGVDRLYHGFWKYQDAEHPKYKEGNPFFNVIKKYHKYIDNQVGEILDILPENTEIMIVSDHGAKGMKGGICINEWLIRQGYLKIIERPEVITPLNKIKIDWKNTAAWGEGGYYSRIFLNVKGREPEGRIEPEEYERIRQELKRRLEAIEDENGNNIGTKVYLPEELYPVVNGTPPDLIVYLGNLDWRSVGSIGHPSFITYENDTGPDDANHAKNGIFILNSVEHYRNSVPIKTLPPPRGNLKIMDVASTVLSLLGKEIHYEMGGKVIN